MKSTIKKSTFLAIHRLLDKVSPVNYDCGTLCSSHCCKIEDELSHGDMVMYLLPGEEKVYTRKESWLNIHSESALDYDFPESWAGKVYFAKCQGVDTCNRTLRPLQCRFFPILPHISNNGELVLIYNDVALPYTCPLIQQKLPLERQFLKANYTVWKRLLSEPLIYDLVMWDSAIREDVEIIYDPL